MINALGLTDAVDQDLSIGVINDFQTGKARKIGADKALARNSRMTQAEAAQLGVEYEEYGRRLFATGKSGMAGQVITQLWDNEDARQLSRILIQRAGGKGDFEDKAGLVAELKAQSPETRLEVLNIGQKMKGWTSARGRALTDEYLGGLASELTTEMEAQTYLRKYPAKASPAGVMGNSPEQDMMRMTATMNSSLLTIAGAVGPGGVMRVSNTPVSSSTTTPKDSNMFSDFINIGNYNKPK